MALMPFGGMDVGEVHALDRVVVPDVGSEHLYLYLDEMAILSSIEGHRRVCDSRVRQGDQDEDG